MLCFAQGQMAAFEELYERYALRVWRYFYRHGGDAALAEDLAQDLWFAVVDNARRYEVRGRFAAWLFTMAHHRLVDHWRQHQGQASLSIDENVGQAQVQALFAASDFAPERRASRRQAAERLLQALAGLPVEQRTAFLLQAEAGMSVMEIAEASKVSVETAKSRLRYARAKLRLALEEMAL